MLDGRAAAAEEILREGCAGLETRGDKAWLATLEAALADALCHQDRFREAVEHAERARLLAPADDVTAQVGWRRSLAKARAATGVPAEGERLAREAIAMLELTDAINDQAAAVTDLAEVLHHAGRPAEADAAAGEGIALFESKGNARGAELARARLATLGGREWEGSPVELPSPRARKLVSE